MGRGQNADTILFGAGTTLRRSALPLPDLEVGTKEGRHALPYVKDELERGGDEITESLASRLVQAQRASEAIMLDEGSQQALARALARSYMGAVSDPGRRERVLLLLRGLFPMRVPETDADHGQCQHCRQAFPWSELSGWSVADGYICSECGGVGGD
jgi:hypothetical protein